ncbi:MAG: 16S rRNA (cytosine(1402)-N(4))-methyltransferase RsmH [Mycoplasmoidaceae bacterium]
MNRKLHIPVLLDESIDSLNIKKDGIYIDCTFGRGGHTFKIANMLSKIGKIIAFDRDNEAIDFFKKNNKYENCFIIKSNFSEIVNQLKEIGIEKVDGIIYDLGISSPQVDNNERGFSYLGNNILDMRMDQSQEKNANFILKNYSYDELFHMFRNYANDRNPIRICRRIIEFRENNLNNDFFANDLVKIIRESINKKILYSKKYPEKKYFQAIRIEVNNEVNEIIMSLNSAASILNKGGRIVVITFNSLEDKIVKDIFAEKSKNLFPKEVPIKDNLKNFNIINKKNIRDDFDLNTRSKSARIRCIERC